MPMLWFQTGVEEDLVSIHIEENDDGTIKALGCHEDLAYDEVNIDAEYEPDVRKDGDSWYWPSKCEITALYIRIRRLDDPVKIDRCHFGKNVIRDWEAAIIDEIEEQ